MSPTTSRRTRFLSGPAKSRYVRALLERHGADPEGAAAADAEIVQVLVRHAAAERPSTRRLAGQRINPPEMCPSPSPSSGPPPTAAINEAASPVPAAAAIPAFNPFAFSAMAVLLNEGRAALDERLKAATTREQFVQLADAQSVRLDPAALTNKKSSIKALRKAFIEAVEKRVAHRRAVSD